MDWWCLFFIIQVWRKDATVGYQKLAFVHTFFTSTLAMLFITRFIFLLSFWYEAFWHSLDCFWESQRNCCIFGVDRYHPSYSLFFWGGEEDFFVRIQYACGIDVVVGADSLHPIHFLFFNLRTPPLFTYSVLAELLPLLVSVTVTPFIFFCVLSVSLESLMLLMFDIIRPAHSCFLFVVNTVFVRIQQAGGIVAVVGVESTLPPSVFRF